VASRGKSARPGYKSFKFDEFGRDKGWCIVKERSQAVKRSLIPKQQLFIKLFIFRTTPPTYAVHVLMPLYVYIG
jgi:hypothetical protein